MKKKHKELALKILEVCKEYNSIEVLDALGNLYFAFVEAQIDNPMARIIAYSDFINAINDKISKTSVKILKNDL